MEPKLKIEYKISKENWLKGYDLYYGLFKKKITFIKAALFLIPLLLFGQQVVMEPSYMAGWVCITICIAIIVGTLIMPKLERKNTANALDAIADDSYVLELFDDKFSITTKIFESEDNLEYDENGEVKPLPEIPASVCELTEKSLKGYETEDLIALFSQRGSFFIPKCELDGISYETIKASLIEALGERYKVKN